MLPHCFLAHSMHFLLPYLSHIPPANQLLLSSFIPFFFSTASFSPSLFAGWRATRVLSRDPHHHPRTRISWFPNRMYYLHIPSQLTQVGAQKTSPLRSCHCGRALCVGVNSGWIHFSMLNSTTRRTHHHLQYVSLSQKNKNTDLFFLSFFLPI